MTADVIADGVSVDYRSPGSRRIFRAVRDVSFTVNAGTSLGIVGESGSGKSSLARVIAGVRPPSSGSLVVQGKERRTALSASERRIVQMVFQDPAASLNPRREIGSVLNELVRRDGLDRRAARARSIALLERVELPTWAYDRRPAELSGGQRQRASIARALAVNPSVIVADEATSALDPSVQRRIIDLFKQLQRDLGISLIFISHNLAVVHELCEDILVLRSGEVVESGSCSEVLRRPHASYTRELMRSVLTLPDQSETSSD